jgi:hypothetical protein
MSNSANTQRARYVVTGIHPVLGHQPGATFTATLSAGQEEALVQGGALRRLPQTQAPTVTRNETREAQGLSAPKETTEEATA